MTPPVFIVGCDRSGTTLLRVMLSRSPLLHIPRETGFIPELWRRRHEYEDFTRPRGRWYFIRDLQRTQATSKTYAFDAFGLDAETVEAELAARAPIDYAGAVTMLYAMSAEREGKSNWGDKTPRYILHVPLLAQLTPNSRFVHIIRDPRDVAASMLAAGWAGSFRRAATFWVERVKAGRKAGRALGMERYREIRYEQLVQEPEQELKKLGAWLGLSYTPEMLRFQQDFTHAVPDEHRDLFPLLEHPVDPSRAFAWKHSMSRHAIAEVEAVAGNLMSDLGYQPTGVRPVAWVSMARWAYRQLLPVAARLRKAGVVTDPAPAQDANSTA